MDVPSVVPTCPYLSQSARPNNASSGAAAASSSYSGVDSACKLKKCGKHRASCQAVNLLLEPIIFDVKKWNKDFLCLGGKF